MRSFVALLLLALVACPGALSQAVPYVVSSVAMSGPPSATPLVLSDSVAFVPVWNNGQASVNTVNSVSGLSAPTPNLGLNPTVPIVASPIGLSPNAALLYVNSPTASALSIVNNVTGGLYALPRVGSTASPVFAADLQMVFAPVSPSTGVSVEFIQAINVTAALTSTGVVAGWKKSFLLAPGSTTSTMGNPVYYQGSLYAAQGGRVYQLNAATGTTMNGALGWDPCGLIAAPGQVLNLISVAYGYNQFGPQSLLIVYGNVTLSGITTFAACAMNPTSGAQLWQISNAAVQQSVSSITGGNNAIFFNLVGYGTGGVILATYVWAVDTMGNTLWKQTRFVGDIASQPTTIAVGPNGIYMVVMQIDGALQALAIFDNLDAGVNKQEMMWTASGPCPGVPVVNDLLDRIACISVGAAINMYRPSDGTTVWSMTSVKPAFPPTFGAPAAEVIYVVDTVGVLWGLSTFAQPVSTPPPSGHRFTNPPTTTPPPTTNAPGTRFDPTPTPAPTPRNGTRFDPTPTPAPTQGNGTKFDPTPTLAPGTKFDPTPTLAPGTKFDPTPTLAPGSKFQTPSPPGSPSSSNTGAIVGAIFGTLAFCGLAGGAAFYFLHYRHRARRPAPEPFEATGLVNYGTKEAP